MFLSADCIGAAHKQDRHNCSVLVTLKLFLSDVSTWCVLVKGKHVTPDSDVLWEPPQSNKQRLDQDLRDLIISQKDKASYEQILSMLKQKFNDLPVVMRRPINKRWLQRVIYAMKQRWQKKNYNVTGEMPCDFLLDHPGSGDQGQNRVLINSESVNNLGFTFIIGDDGIFRSVKKVMSQTGHI